MKKRFVYLILIVTLINLTALVTMIYRGWIVPDLHISEDTRESRFEQVKRELALTPAQIHSFEQIRERFHSRLDSLDHTLGMMRQHLLKEIWHPQPVESRVDSLLDRISRLQMESQHLVIWHFYRFKEVLTPEQWQTFYGIVSKRFPDRYRVTCLDRPVQTEVSNP